jgi:Zn2+/Cd2+-exporting ATPase
MTRTQIELPVLLPLVPDEKDSCVRRLIEHLESREGIQKVHLASKEGNDQPVLCFHFDPQIISLARIRSIAKSTGAQITDTYGHLLFEVTGVRHIRHARIIERTFNEEKGILEASVSGGGFIRLEYERDFTTFENIKTLLEKEGLSIRNNSLTASNFDKLATKRLLKEEHKTYEKEIDQHIEKGSHETGGSHEHEHSGIFGTNSELIFSIISGLVLGLGFTFSFIDSIPAEVSLTLYITAYIFGGYYTAKEAIETVAKGGFEIDFLMLVAAIGAAILGVWAEGALLLFLFSLGHALEHYAMDKAHKSIAALAGLAPKTALLKRDGNLEEVSIEKLHIGDIIVVKPHTGIGADGVVLKGNSSVNQAPITGESIPVDKVAVQDIYRDYGARR